MAKKPMARPATQKEYNAKMQLRGKMTDTANKERMKKMSQPSMVKDMAKKPKSKGPMATRVGKGLGGTSRMGLAGLAAAGAGYIGGKIAGAVKAERKTRKKLEEAAKNKRGK